MIIKLVRKLQEFKGTNDNGDEGAKTLLQTQVYANVQHYDVTNLVKAGSLNEFVNTLSFNYGGEYVSFDLLNYSNVYIMNDEGKTIDTLRSV